VLDQQLEAMLQQAQAAGLPDLCDLPPQPCRDLYRQICAAADVPPADVGLRDVPATECGVPLRVYTPRSAGPHALVVYYHGGGYVLGDIAAYDNVCRRLCADSGAMVVSVEYRLAPEHPWPAAFDDAWAALQWLAANAQRLEADASRLAVAGDSAGAILATAVARRARDEGGAKVAFQALIYPPAAGGDDGDFPSRQRHAAGPTLTLRTIEYFHRHVFGSDGRAPDAFAAPLRATDLAGLPPALLQVAGFDPLRDEALAYGAALRRAGNAVTVVEYHGLAHGYISMGALGAARLAQRQLADALRAALCIAH
jgi:acetyl esterase